MDGTNCVGVAVGINMETVPVEKDDERELPVPTEWRLALKQLADKAVLGTEIKDQSNIEIGNIDSNIASNHHYNIQCYPDALGPLTDKSWETSIYIWDSPYWRVLVDLTDLNGQVTDLVLHASGMETDKGFLIEPDLIYVP